MYDSIAALKGEPQTALDMYGNEIVTYTSRPVYVQPRSVYRSEFYSAAQAGLHPNITFDMANRMDYNGERLIEWNGKLYNIIRTDWNAQRDGISLVCEERVNNG